MPPPHFSVNPVKAPPLRVQPPPLGASDTQAYSTHTKVQLPCSILRGARRWASHKDKLALQESVFFLFAKSLPSLLVFCQLVTRLQLRRFHRYAELNSDFIQVPSGVL